MKESCEIAIVGSGFAGSLLARVLAALGYDVVLLERGSHPRFAIGESSTPLANLSLERIGARYGFEDCYDLAAHGRWVKRYPNLRRGLKRGFTFYRHHPEEAFANERLKSERLLVAASPDDAIADSHWLRADVDQHFMHRAVAAGVDYRDHVNVVEAVFDGGGVSLKGDREGVPFSLRAGFLIDASGPNGFLARQLSIPSAVGRTKTRSSLIYSHFDGMRLMADAVPGLPPGPYPDDWAAVHHIIDEGWMYSLRFDDGVTSAGFLVSPAGLESLRKVGGSDADALWSLLLRRYPTIASVFDGARLVMPIAFRLNIQHRLATGAGERWAMMPHAYAFVDPLFSTGIAWSLRAVERLALLFESAASSTARFPVSEQLQRYDRALSAEADQIDFVVAGAYESMAHFDLFTAQAMLYFAAVSFAEATQRMNPDDDVAWMGFLGVGDPVLRDLPHASFARLRDITRGRADPGSPAERRGFVEWMALNIAPRNVAGLANAERNNLYPVDFDALVDSHQKMGLTREEVVAALPRLRGMSAAPDFSGKKGSFPGLAQALPESASFTADSRAHP